MLGEGNMQIQAMISQGDKYLTQKKNIFKGEIWINHIIRQEEKIKHERSHSYSEHKLTC